MEIVDFYTQAYPGQYSALLPEKARSRARSALQPFSSALHEVRPFLRFLPPGGRDLLEKITDEALHAPFLLVESSARDLETAMKEANIRQAVVVSDGDRISNDFVLDLSTRNSALIPAVQIVGPVDDVREHLRRMRDRGARVLKISQEQKNALPLPVLRELIQEAAVLKMPVILKSVTDLETLLQDSRGTPVILAHMGGSSAPEAMDLAERFEHLFLETSRQPTEAIAEAVRRMGSQRVIYGSDWPRMGNNMQVGLQRIQDALQSEMITESDAENILMRNAKRILEGQWDADPS